MPRKAAKSRLHQSGQQQSTGQHDLHRNAPGAEVDKTGDRLTTLPPETFRAIIEETLDLYNFDSLARTIKKCSVCKLFNIEIVAVLLRNWDRGEIVRLWTKSGPQFLRVSLLREKALANPRSELPLLASIHLVVNKIQELQRDWSDQIQRKWLDAACACIALRGWDLTSYFKEEQTYGDMGTKEKILQRVEEYCCVVAAWEGDLALLKTLQAKTIELSRKRFGSDAGLMIDCQRAATGGGHCGAIRHLKRLGFDFGRPREYLDNTPLYSAWTTRQINTFQSLLPDLDSGRDQRSVASEIARQGQLGWAEILWAPERWFDAMTETNAALWVVCSSGRRNQAQMAQILIGAGAEVNRVFDDHPADTPFTRAIRNGQPPDLIRLLIQHGSMTRAGLSDKFKGHRLYIDPLMTAIEHRNQDAVEALLECGTWETRTQKNALCAAVEAGGHEGRQDAGILSLLLRGFEPRRSARTADFARQATRRAILLSPKKVVDALLDHGCGVDLDTNRNRL